MSKPEKLLAEWGERTPKEARYEDVEAVALAFLGTENVRIGEGTSHTLIVDGPLMKVALKLQKRGLSEVAWLEGDTLSIPRNKGRKVKKPYINQLVKLIAFKQSLDALTER